MASGTRSLGRARRRPSARTEQREHGSRVSIRRSRSEWPCGSSSTTKEPRSGEAMVLPVRARAAGPADRPEPHPGQACVTARRRHALAPGPDERLRLVEPDRDRGLDPPDQPRGGARLRLRERPRPGYPGPTAGLRLHSDGKLRLRSTPRAFWRRPSAKPSGLSCATTQRSTWVTERGGCVTAVPAHSFRGCSRRRRAPPAPGVARRDGSDGCAPDGVRFEHAASRRGRCGRACGRRGRSAARPSASAREADPRPDEHLHGARPHEPRHEVLGEDTFDLSRSRRPSAPDRRAAGSRRPRRARSGARRDRARRSARRKRRAVVTGHRSRRGSASG